ncbi:MAG: homocysteine S-methyltransferase family protein, partial [Gemmatimonadota bacterium]|nr:homocysteine S-methyltransferase family protein [Gemmatimonadota bacterium]
ERNVDILGVNCGSGVDSLWAARAIERYKNVTDRPTMAQPNAGQPTLENLRVVYRQTPEEMGEQYKTLLNAEPNIVGGCCGTGPEHIRIFRQLVSERNC